jgi:hypothetical protein
MSYGKAEDYTKASCSAPEQDLRHDVTGHCTKALSHTGSPPTGIFLMPSGVAAVFTDLDKPTADHMVRKIPFYTDLFILWVLSLTSKCSRLQFTIQYKFTKDP